MTSSPHFSVVVANVARVEPDSRGDFTYLSRGLPPGSIHADFDIFEWIELKTIRPACPSLTQFRSRRQFTSMVVSLE